MNTLPLVWGILKGPQRGSFALDFAVPSECAERLRDGASDIGIVPCAELPSLGLEIIRGTGIACRGPVRSILLVSKTPPQRIRRLALDASSRTSAALARIVLERRYGNEPETVTMAPDLHGMLEAADAALIIGDPALRIDPAALPYTVLDLGAEWVAMTGLPMVFAVWAGRPGVVTPAVERAFLDSCRYGAARLDEVIQAAPPRGISLQLARDYLTRHIVFEPGPRDYEGMDLFLSYAERLANVSYTGSRSS